MADVPIMILGFIRNMKRKSMVSVEFVLFVNTSSSIYGRR